MIAETTVPYELIVLDNASPDGRPRRSARLSGRPADRERGELGFAEGNNVAAREAKAKYLLLLNPDTLVLDRAVDRITDFTSGRRRRASGAAARSAVTAG